MDLFLRCHLSARSGQGLGILIVQALTQADKKLNNCAKKENPSPKIEKNVHIIHYPKDHEELRKFLVGFWSFIPKWFCKDFNYKLSSYFKKPWRLRWHFRSVQSYLGNEFVEYHKFLSKSLFWSEEEIKQYQWQKLKELMK